MPKHLSACPQRQELIAKTEHLTPLETLYHLRVEDAGQSDYWLDLEMRASATMQNLDRYLRAIWLECCGHLSRFSIGGWDGKQIAKQRRAAEIFKPRLKLIHIYDFGSSSITSITVAEHREGKPTTRHPIALMARNLPPAQYCIECAQPAAWLCMECVGEENTWGTLCDRHAQTHDHHDYGEPFPIVNSPRLGTCGYSGPAEPPY